MVSDSALRLGVDLSRAARHLRRRWQSAHSGHPRREREGYNVEAIELDAAEPVPDGADLYLLGGGGRTTPRLPPPARCAPTAGSRVRPPMVPWCSGCAPATNCLALFFLALMARLSQGSDCSTSRPIGCHTARLAKLLALPYGDGLEQPLTGYENHAGGDSSRGWGAPAGARRGRHRQRHRDRHRHRYPDYLGRRGCRA